MVSQRFMNFRSSGTFIRDFLRYGNGVVIILAVFYTLLFYSLAECEPDSVVLVLSGLLGFLTYSYDRMHDLGEESDIINAPQRTNWLREHYTFMVHLCAIAVVISLIAMLLRPAAIFPIISTIGLACAYSLPILPDGRSLKKIPGVKTALIVVLWVILTFLVPMTVSGIHWSFRIIGGILYESLMIVSFANLNDIRDTRGDRLAGVPTIPVIFGVRIAFFFSLVTIIAATMVGATLGNWVLVMLGVMGTIGLLFNSSKVLEMLR